MHRLLLFLFLLFSGIAVPEKAAARSAGSETRTTWKASRDDLSRNVPLTPIVIEAGDFQHSRCLSQQRHFHTTAGMLPEIFHLQYFVALSFAQRQPLPLRKHLLYCILRC